MYTDTQVARMVKLYTAAETVEARSEAVVTLAKEMDKTVRSIIAKLSREGVYVKIEKVRTQKIRKDALVAQIAEVLQVDAKTRLSGLVKSNVDTLKLILANLS